MGTPYFFFFNFPTVQQGGQVILTCIHYNYSFSLKYIYIFVFCLFVVVVVAISWAAPTAYGGSQARGLIGAVATGLHHSHNNAGSKPRLRPTPRLTATPDP